jgi:hypothetical protein
MKIRFYLVVAVVMILSLMPSFAAGFDTIIADGTYDIGSYGNDSTITIDSLDTTDGLIVTLTNTGDITFTN